MLVQRHFHANGHDLIMKAPLGILVLYRNDVSKNLYEYKDHIQSAGAAIENLLLKATELGLGTCWICKLPTQKKMHKLFNIISWKYLKVKVLIWMRK